MPRAGGHGRTSVGSSSYIQVAASLRFDLSALTLTGAAGATYTDTARVYDQFGVLMNPQPSGTISYSSGSGSIATVNSSTGLITSVADGQSVLTATFTPSGGPVTWLNDTFTDTATTLASAHTGETGATWTIHPSASGTAQISDANRLRATNTTIFCYYASGTPANADYDVTAVLRIKSNGTGESTGIFGRLNTAALTGYFVRYEFGTGAWKLYWFNAAAATQLGTFSQVLTVGNDYTVKLEMRGTTLNVYIDTVLRITATDTNVVAAGRVGVRTSSASAAGDTVGIHFDSITAEDAA